MMKIKELAKKNKQYVINMRREFHMYPEPSMKEFRTSKRIVEELEKVGIPCGVMGQTGVAAVIDGSKPGKTVALRADIDALELQELNEIPYKSKNDGLMHGCGHDGHAAMLLGAARILNEIKDEFCGKGKLIFQPGEEIAQGAAKMIKEGVMEGVDGVFGIHLWSGIECGSVSLEAGPRMAATDLFKILVKGRGGHGSMPHQGIDAVVAASSIVMNLQSIVSREISPLESVVVSVGKIESGTRFNVIAGEAELTGGTRCFSTKIRNELPHMIERIAKNTAASYKAEAEVEYTLGTAPVINDEISVNIGQGAVEKILGREALVHFEKITGGEDFSLFMEKAPGAFALVGIANKQKDTCYPHHYGKFNMDEEALEIGCALYAQYAVDFLRRFCERQIHG